MTLTLHRKEPQMQRNHFCAHPAVSVCGTLAILLFSSNCADAAEAQPSSPRVWSPIMIDFEGPSAKQTDDDPNPFLDYRLQVRFTGPEGREFDVPGYFAGDGAGGGSGNVWRVHFSADRPGTWKYVASFRSGKEIAVDLDADHGEPAAFDGASGVIEVAPRDPQAPGFFKWGRLEFVGGHYLKFADGPYWIRGGTDSPENLLAYAGFDNTLPNHTFQAHEKNWRPGDPDWGEGRGKGIIGAINYLAAHHVNSIYFLMMNVGGDGKDVWPWVKRPKRKGDPSNDNLHYDIGQLRQWDMVFDHAQRMGVFLHIVLNEAEKQNKRELDDGELGVERKLYYRELVARFAHYPALQWNLCEEYNLQFDFGAERVRAFADYIAALDPYQHPITVHSAGNPIKALQFTFGDPRFSMTSIQLGHRRIDEVTEEFRKATQQAGRPLPVSLDEFTVDVGTNAGHIPVDVADRHRREKLWPTLLSGGMIEFILEGFLKVDRFDTEEREALWDYTWYARKFLEENTPFWEMEPADSLVTNAATIEIGVGRGKREALGAQVFAKPGAVYAIYLPRADGTGELDLSEAAGEFEQRWYNPRTGEFDGEPQVIEGGKSVKLGAPPREAGEDWAILIVAKKADAKPSIETDASSSLVFPQESWATMAPQELGLDAAKLDDLALMLGGRGCVVKDGYVVKTWGSQSKRGDWLSSSKPVLGTLLMFAMQEGLVPSVDTPLTEFGWDLVEKDRTMTFRHLANMTSGYARPDPPGAAWAYNDFAIQLYQQTLFDRVFKGDPEEIANAPERLGGLDLEDGLSFREQNRRMSASVRDFARIAWLWLNRGRWNGRQLLPQKYFDELMQPQVPRDLPHTEKAETNDYLKIGSYGGGSDHFTKYGPGIYGFNWWFNDYGRQHPQSRTWPDAPADIFLSIGFGGNCAAIFPSEKALLVAAKANWGKIKGGDAQERMNRVLKQFSEAVHATNDSVGQ